MKSMKRIDMKTDLDGKMDGMINDGTIDDYLRTLGFSCSSYSNIVCGDDINYDVDLLYSKDNVFVIIEKKYTQDGSGNVLDMATHKMRIVEETEGKGEGFFDTMIGHLFEGRPYKPNPYSTILW